MPKALTHDGSVYSFFLYLPDLPAACFLVNQEAAFGYDYMKM
jgi:hypothetical protein